MKIYNLFGLEITCGTYDEIIQEIDNSIIAKKRFKLHNVNSYIILEANKNEEFKRELQKFSRLYIDGIGVYLGIKILHGRRVATNRITGTDLYYKILNYAIETNSRVFFLGVNGLSKETIRSNIVSKFPSLVIAGIENDNGLDDHEVVEKINHSATDILLVGLGTPKQEKFIIKNSDAISCPVQIAVGSGIEYIAGTKKRAPLIAQITGLEWLFRFFLEPKRLWRRYLFGIPHFMWLILKQKLEATERVL